ncbi:hypothetical protein KQI52_11400 [bacterium]|nr:hypothetical protein [bacterium]
MKQVLLGTLVGGVIFFIFLSISWTVLPFHTMAFTPLEDSKPIAEAMQANNLETGLYTVPSMTEYEANSEEFIERHKAGPVVPFLVYYAEGLEMMSAMMYVKGIIMALLAAGIVSVMMKLAGRRLRRYPLRVLVATAMGVFAAVIGPLTLGNWMMFPAGYVWAEVFDQVIGWTFAGAGIAAFVKPRSL